MSSRACDLLRKRRDSDAETAVLEKDLTYNLLLVFMILMIAAGALVEADSTGDAGVGSPSGAVLVLHLIEGGVRTSDGRHVTLEELPALVAHHPPDAEGRRAVVVQHGSSRLQDVLRVVRGVDGARAWLAEEKQPQGESDE